MTFGCQMNKYDSLLVEGRFVESGWRVTPDADEADAILFNTCSVRDHAEERVWSWLGELKRVKERRPELVIGVLGCMAQRTGAELFARAGHVDVVCGTRRIQHLPEMVAEVLERRADPDRCAPEASRLLDIEMDSAVVVDREHEVYTGGLAGYLAVMRGCDLNCAFCVVPMVRGRVQSRLVDDLIREARWMVAGGARVITLLGQTVNSYGEDLPKPGPGEPRLRGRQGRASLADLLYALQDVDGLERIRLITLHPSYVTRALAEAIRDCDKVDRFLPLPAQSGSDDVLRRMRRGYTTDLYRRRVEILRAAVPDLELGSDWIVGFPGETDEDFERSERFVEQIGFAQGYVFQYSPRPDTAAFDVVDDVPQATKKERNQRLLRAVERSALGRMQRWIGATVPVFVEAESAKRAGVVKGRTFHGLPVSFTGPPELVGTATTVAIGNATGYGLAG
ncbi:MAG: tRNA (N6-isopentenyl adenosine(37)-C2)-methylthiotransferase MiaB [Planctomycetota bacterium]|nr:tRNA (N6-isopentenyl adenosine(37)-C2)-methylthiotransferase MiaB [Planctomycetota bacterium]